MILDRVSRKRIRKYLRSPFDDVFKKSSSRGDSVIVLDGIRGLAVLIVLASHTGALALKAQGSVGVFLFFFLSGYVLSIPYVSDPFKMLEVKEIRRFVVNRMLRIAPIYIVIVSISAVTMDKDIQWFLWNISFVKGWNHFWSVAEEVRFYFMFPLVILLSSIAKNSVLRVIALVCLTVVAYKFRGFHRIDMFDGRSVLFYFYMFLGGCSTCFLVASSFVSKIMDNRYFKILFSVFTCFIFLFIFFSSNVMVENLWRPVFSYLPEDFSLNGWKISHVWVMLFGIFFYSLVAYRSGIVYRLLTTYLFRHIGLLSYSIYLIHILFVYEFAEYGFEKEKLFVVVFLFSYVSALLGYLIVEKPFLLLKVK